MQNEFKVLVKRKIPYLTKGLGIILVVMILILILLYFFMQPSTKASYEMATAYFILAVPEWLKKASVFAGVVLIVFLPIYFAARLKISALLSLSEDSIIIKGKNLDTIIPFKNIKRIYFNDLKNFLQQPKDKMQIVVQQKDDNSIVFLLANYYESGVIIDTFSKVISTEYSIFATNSLEMFSNEE